ncbi:MAG: hypothetical protein FD130_608 [Halothiobacillaceae bacterium]|nr:MAG: hypothetical protein FD130_608 [Halothiobacillaceae bacterium]
MAKNDHLSAVHQQGIALVTALLFLTTLTLIGLATSSATTLHTLIARNSQSDAETRNNTVQTSFNAQHFLSAAPLQTNDYVDVTASTRLFDPRTDPWPERSQQSTSRTQGFYIEYLGCWVASGHTLIPCPAHNSSPATHYYRTTSYAHGSQGEQRFLQRLYHAPFAPTAPRPPLAVTLLQEITTSEF